jgi:hypothetical protein
MSEQGNQQPQSPEQQHPKSAEEKRQERIGDLMELNEQDLQSEAERVSDAFTEEDRKKAEHLMPEDVVESREAINADVEELLDRFNFDSDTDREEMANIMRRQLAKEYSDHEYESQEGDEDHDDMADLRVKAAEILALPQDQFEDFAGRWTEYDDVQNAIAEVEHEADLRSEAESMDEQFKRRERGLETGDEMVVDGKKYEVRNVETDDEGKAKFATIRVQDVDKSGNPTGRYRVVRGTVGDVTAMLPPEMTGANAPEGDKRRNETVDQTLDRLEKTLNTENAQSAGGTESQSENSNESGKSQYEQDLDYLSNLEEKYNNKSETELPEEVKEHVKSLLEELRDVILRLREDQYETNESTSGEEGSTEGSVSGNEGGTEGNEGSGPEGGGPENGGPDQGNETEDTQEVGKFKGWWERTKWALKNPRAWLQGKTFDVLTHDVAEVGEDTEKRRGLGRKIALGAAALGVAGLVIWATKGGHEAIAGTPTAADIPQGGGVGTGGAEAALNHPPVNEAASFFYPDSLNAKPGDTLWDIGRDMLERSGVQNPDVTQIDAVKDALVATNETYGPQNGINIGQQIDTTAGQAVVQRLMNGG